MLNWLHSHRTLRGARAPRSDAGLARVDATPGRDEPDVAADLIGQARRPGESGVPTVANDALWLPPLWLSW